MIEQFVFLILLFPRHYPGETLCCPLAEQLERSGESGEICLWMEGVFPERVDNGRNAAFPVER